MAIAKFTTQIIRQEDIAKGTFAVYLKKPVGFMYQAGQFINVTLSQIADRGLKECRRSMSLASAPYEEFLMLAMRESESLFKKTLRGMKDGENLEIDGPFGHVTMEGTSFRAKAGDQIVMIAGGIGITPFRGIILDEKEKGWSRPVTLIYGNRNPEKAAFLDELKNLENPNYKIIPIMSETDLTDWQEEKGRINEKTIRKFVPEISKAVYMIVGLPEMVKELRGVLSQMGIPEKQIIFELFTGYNK